MQTRENLQPLVVTPGKELNNKYGYYRHEDFVGVPYGSKVGARNKKGFVHLLRPTPELWTLSLPHRTQILYLADIAFVTSWLNIKPGSRVVEAGKSARAPCRFRPNSPISPQFGPRWLSSEIMRWISSLLLHPLIHFSPCRNATV